MKRLSLAALTFGLALQTAFAAGERILSEDGTVLTLTVEEGTVWTNAVPIEDSVTQIVKNGGGEACFVPLTNTTFSGSVTINAGFLSGFQNSFGKPSALTINNGGAILFLDLQPEALGAGASPFSNADVTVCGNGPDGYGAVQRPVTLSSRPVNGLFKKVTLTGNTMFNCGSRWGFASTVLDMNGHTLTISAAKHSHNNGPTMWNADNSPIFNVAVGGNLSVADPGEIVAVDGAKLRIEGGSKVADAADSSGFVSNMVFKLTDGTRFTFSKATNPSCFIIRSLGTSIIETLNTDGVESKFNGIIDAAGTECRFSGAGTLRIGANGRIVGGAKIQRMHDESGSLILDGEGVSATSSALNNGFWSRSKGVFAIAGNAQFAPHGLWVGHNAVAYPARLELTGNALLAQTNDNPAAQAYIGGRNRDESHLGIVRIADNAVYSNVCSLGWCGRGAVYVAGGSFFPRFMSGYENLLYVGYYGNGYVGVDSGLMRHSYHFNLAHEDDESNNCRGRGFLVQRGGRVEHLGKDRYIRMGRKGNNAYAAIAQLGGISVCSNHIATGYNSAQPDGYGSKAVLTVDGQGTVMDMSKGRIQVIASTNVHLKPAVTIINVNNGAVLTVEGMYRTQVTDASSPQWSTLDKTHVHAASPAYLNFNGGIVRNSREGDFFFGADRVLTRATVYEKGATIDTCGLDISFRMPLLRPHGRGIKSVALPDALSAAEATNLLISPTRCHISDTTGYGADVLLDFSNDTRRVHGVIVTSPGCGYSATPVVEFEKQSDWTSRWTCPSVETVDYDAPEFAHGGFTKRGEGTLTLMSSNTWGGITRIEGGTLRFSHPDGYPGGDLEIASAAVLAQSSPSTPSVSAISLDFGEGRKLRITEADTAVWKNLSRPQVIVETETPFESMPVVEFVSEDGEQVIPRASVFMSDGGRKLKLAYRRGTAVILR